MVRVIDVKFTHNHSAKPVACRRLSREIVPSIVTLTRMSELGTFDPSQLYRRQARRIRGRYSARPGQLYRSLRQLSDRHDALAAKLPDQDAILPVSRQRADAFAQLVTDRMEGTILRYSTRCELIHIAARLGISRFDANLMIAAVQHQLGHDMAQFPAEHSRSKWPLILAAIVILQSGIILAAWGLFAR